MAADVTACPQRSPWLGEALRAWRADEGLSRLAAAQTLGVAHTTQRSWEAGNALPSVSACQRLEMVHGLPRDSLTRLRRDAPVAVADGRSSSRSLPGMTR